MKKWILKTNLTNNKSYAQQQFGKMAEMVLKRKFSFQKSFCAKKEVSASKSATSPSCKTLPPMVGQNNRHIIFAIRTTFGVLTFFQFLSCGQDNNKNTISADESITNRQMITHIKLIETILYVDNQEASCKFYQNIFRKEADLNVPGMTEFNLSDNCKIGIMPNKGIAKILADNTPHPDSGNGIPRCELYLYVDNIQLEFDNAIKSGAKLISPIIDRDWGDKVCYFSDPDGHIIAFAEKIKKEN